MLFLFLTTAHILVFLKASLMYFVSNNLAVSSLKITSFFLFNSSAEPGKMQHNFSSSFAVWGESTVNLAGIDFFILVDKRVGCIAIALPRLPLNCRCWFLEFPRKKFPRKF